MGRKPLTEEQKAERLKKTQEKIMTTPAQQFLNEFLGHGIIIWGSHNNGHLIGAKKTKTGNTESGEDSAVYIFEVMPGQNGAILRKPRYSTTAGGKVRTVVYPQLCIEWCQAENVARAILQVIGGEGGKIKDQVLSSDSMVREERVAAQDIDNIKGLEGFDV